MTWARAPRPLWVTSRVTRSVSSALSTQPESACDRRLTPAPSTSLGPGTGDPRSPSSPPPPAALTRVIGPLPPGLWPYRLSSLPSKAAHGPWPQARFLPFHSPLRPGPLCTFSDGLWEHWGQPLPASGSAPPPPGGMVALEFQPFSGSREKKVPSTGWGGGGNIRVHRCQASRSIRIPAPTPVVHP